MKSTVQKTLLFLYFQLERTIEGKLEREKLRLSFSCGWREEGNGFCLILLQLLLKLKYFKSSVKQKIDCPCLEQSQTHLQVKKTKLKFVGITRLSKDILKDTDVKLLNYFGIHLLGSGTKNI